jgi:hypothetical protein
MWIWTNYYNTEHTEQFAELAFWTVMVETQGAEKSQEA